MLLHIVPFPEKSDFSLLYIVVYLIYRSTTEVRIQHEYAIASRNSYDFREVDESVP
jgi:hypothetical protein